MIDSRALLRMAEDAGGVVIVDIEGEPVDDGRVLVEIPVPGLLVSDVSEAVKTVDGGRVTGYLDRDSLLSVRGFVLGPEVLIAVADDVYTPAELVAAVTAAGFEWRMIPPDA